MQHAQKRWLFFHLPPSPPLLACPLRYDRRTVTYYRSSKNTTLQASGSYIRAIAMYVVGPESRCAWSGLFFSIRLSIDLVPRLFPVSLSLKIVGTRLCVGIAGYCAGSVSLGAWEPSGVKCNLSLLSEETAPIC